MIRKEFKDTHHLFSVLWKEMKEIMVQDSQIFQSYGIPFIPNLSLLVKNSSLYKLHPSCITFEPDI